jgi:hypothetical protein
MNPFTESKLASGPTDAHGRRMLSGTEMAFAIAFALTDRRPDPQLMQAAKAGQL